ncbi:MFS transporter, partial [Escherichia coli]
PVKTTIATALFMMFGLSYSLMNCSYGAMIPAITKNPNERAQLAAYRQGGATIGLLICTVAFIPLQSLFSDSTVGYACAALMFSIGGFIFMMLCYRGVKEHYV